jgi:AsmA protein
MAVNVKKIVFRTLKIAGITIVSLLILLFTLPSLFPGTVSNKIKQWANGSINGNLTFSHTGLSFFKHFPTLTLTLYDVTLKGSAPFQNDTLVAAKELSLGINLQTVFEKKIKIDKIFLSQAFINIQVDTLGHANYNVYKSQKQQPKAAADTASASLGINQILIDNSRLVYNDRSIPMTFIARGFNYTGSGDLTKDIFDLHTQTDIKSVDFIYGGKTYLLSKSVNANLITKINTKSLEFIFQRNDLFINKFPVKFNGHFGFLKNGYDMDLNVESRESSLHDMITALPPEYVQWLNKTDVRGIGNVQLRIAGQYIAADSLMPDLSLNIKVRDGFINNEKSPAPVTNLYMNFDVKLPGLDPDSLNVNLDSLFFNINKDHFNAIMRVKGVKEPEIYAKVNTQINLEQWNNAFGIKPVQLKGKYSLQLLASGKYATAVKRTGLHKKDTVITSIPKFTLKSALTDGYFKYAKLPQPIKSISFNMNASCPDNDYHHANFEISNLGLYALDNYVKGYLKASAANGFPVDAALQAKFNLADIKKFYPIDSIWLSGKLLANLQTKGRYLPARKIFPVTQASISLQNGSVQTKYYPHPISNIQVNTNIFDSGTSLKGLRVNIQPVSFVFEGKPFAFSADLRNFENINYKIGAHGTLDIGKIYKVFAIKDYDVRGQIQANISLKGDQKDALAHNFNKLSNSGTLIVNNIRLTSDLFPKPFFINNGQFSFNQDKMLFNQFKATYGRSVIYLNGSLTNVIDYATRPGAILNGDLNFGSASIIADDFMAFAGSSSSPSASTSSGVIMVPKTLNLNLSADVKNVRYNGMKIKDVKGAMAISNGSIILKQTGFTIIDAPVKMDATYTSLSAKKAVFNYHINAQNFDIKKAYNQIKLFHDMATSAANAEGIVSLDYQLAGRLNSNMRPVYPSLTGGGTLSVQKVKVHGFKLFGSVGNKTNHNGIDSGDVSKVDIKTTIVNNIITIQQTKMRMAGFRLKFSGQVSFDNQLNLNFRLGLPPFGIFGIPMHITGTEDKPNIHLGKGGKDDELKATDDTGNQD